MQIESGLYKFLGIDWVYNALQKALGRNFAVSWIAKNFWECLPGQKVIDMGCGPGTVLEYLPNEIEYVGFDFNQQYIDSAKAKYGHRGKFLVGSTDDFMAERPEMLNGADRVFCSGFLHHLDDEEACQTLILAKEMLAPGGKLVCVEAVYLIHQTWLSEWVVSRDRGQNIRTEQQWKELTGQVFGNFTTHILTGLLRIPYVHIIIQGYKN